MKKILGVYREKEFCNNAVEADRAILEASLSHLEGAGYQIELVNPSKIPASGKYDLALTMAQGQDSLARLEELSRRVPGKLRMINSVQAVRNCYRMELDSSLRFGGFAYPRSVKVHTEEKLRTFPFQSNEGFWVKRGDFHALTDEDVQKADTVDDLNRVLYRFRERGVSDVVIQEHLPGDVIKFYAIRGKFFDADVKEADVVRNEVEKLAHHLGLEVFGGDFVLGPSGRRTFIDFNDWPSFRRVREKAARAIADYATQILEERKC